MIELRQGNKQAGIELQILLSQKLNTTVNSAIVGIKEYYEEQSKFFDDIVNKETLNGLVLYGNNKKSTKQFMGLSNIIKRIAPTDFVVIGARPSVGKTSFALALMNALYKNGYKPLFISLEMTNGELLQRMASSKAGLSYDLMLSPEATLTPEQIGSYKSGLFEASGMDIKVIDRPPTSWLEMKQLIIERKDEIDYVVIDHLHIISTYDGQPNSNKNQMYGDISRDMKFFARDYKIPIIVLAQLSREVRSVGRKLDPTYVEPNMTDIRDSGNIEQDADKIMFLYREDQGKERNPLHAEYGNFPIVLKVDKNRAGKQGKVKYNFQAKTGRWSEQYEKKIKGG